MAATTAVTAPAALAAIAVVVAIELVVIRAIFVATEPKDLVLAGPDHQVASADDLAIVITAIVAIFITIAAEPGDLVLGHGLARGALFSNVMPRGANFVRSSPQGTMIFQIDGLIDAATLARLRAWLSEAAFEDGRATAGPDARRVKHNEQVGDDPRVTQMQDLVLDKLWDNDAIATFARPKSIRPPLFSRYTVGMQYGRHVDAATMDGDRVDMSITIFLSDPNNYDGGELVIELGGLVGDQRVKLPAGSAVLYPTTTLHRVAPVTRGERLAAVTWVRSLVRDAAAREILIDLEVALEALADRIGPTPELVLISKAHSNLLRRWIED